MGSIDINQNHPAVQVDIPIIDISGYLAGDPDAKRKAAAEFRQACENQGFLQVVGHSVPEAIQQRFLAGIASFFALPLSQKEKVSQTKSKCHRGYERVGGQKLDELDDSATPDQKEGFSVRRDRPLGRFLQGPNQWPEPEPESKPETETEETKAEAELSKIPTATKVFDHVQFQESYMAYFDAVHDLSKAVFRLLALSLDLSEDHFDAFAADPDGLCLCRAHHYPPTPVDAAGRTRGVGAHTDFGALTLLLQDEVGGLEVLHKPTGTWHNVPPIKGAYVCNIGDLMQIWTNNRYKSTMHRVISPLSGKDRYSCAFFNDGALDTVVECLPTCRVPGQRPVYEPLKVEAHLVQRYLQSYGAAGTVLVS
ncbi:hypothetical protein A1O3_01354 [Capronia epimyces CBS 606.96]|uniref:Fe2OG dioxygenase domain-containing protein n=1 Tax=Capronia epimyces CBS 606.96 TaxID=1182542 RepID=W9YSZ0_9EURO|nr:uncharacterized protein A1O3_01354 [Capronia epimyces CBS 606.96]EXJ92800.1 hypothetical protein A1O3_01354 [Capronia epimyces CBS 606.96]